MTVDSEQLAVGNEEKQSADSDQPKLWPELNYQEFKAGMAIRNPKTKTFSRKKLRAMHRKYKKARIEHNNKVKEARHEAD